MSDNLDAVLNQILNDAVTDAFTDAYNMGMLKQNELSFVPELYMYADDVCSNIYRDVYKALIEDGDKPSLDAFPSTVGRFCICAGMGAVVHWNVDYAGLKKKGLYETLIEPRGIFAMDEYVYDLVDMDFESEECNDFIAKSIALFKLTITRTVNKIQDEISNDKKLIDSVMSFILTNVYKILYKVGIAIQLQSTFKSSSKPEPKANDGSSDNVTEEEPGKYDSDGLERVYNKMKAVFNPAMKQNDGSDKAYTSELINNIFSQFTHLSIDDKYVFDFYTYVYHYPTDMKRFVPQDYN